jgi:hypothetical protein
MLIFAKEHLQKPAPSLLDMPLQWMNEVKHVSFLISKNFVAAEKLPIGFVDSFSYQ